MEEILPGVRRVTMPLPQRPGHIHCYLLDGEDGWTVVDTGLGLPDARDRWQAELSELPGRVARIFVTHLHPDHVGAAADLHALTGAPVVQGALDYAQCELVWGNQGWPDRIAAWLVRHGTPVEILDDLLEQGRLYRPFIRFQRDPVLVEPGASVGGWTTVALSGHADGQLGLLRDGVLVGADHLLDPITPAIGLWPASRPDPLGDYLEALARTESLEARIVLPGHGEAIADPGQRAREIVAHHAERLETAGRALTAEPQSGFTLSYALFGADLKPGGRRFAVAETLSHLERLVQTGVAVRHESVGTISYTAG